MTAVPGHQECCLSRPWAAEGFCLAPVLQGLGSGGVTSSSFWGQDSPSQSSLTGPGIPQNSGQRSMVLCKRVRGLPHAGDIHYCSSTGLWEIRSPGYVSSRLGQALEVEHMSLFLGFLSDVTSPLLPVCPSPCPF